MMENEPIKALKNQNIISHTLLYICTLLIVFSQATTNKIYDPGYLSYFAFIFLGLVSSILVLPWLLKSRNIQLSLVDFALIVFLLILTIRWLLTPDKTICNKGSVIIAILPIYLYIRSLSKIDIIHKAIVIVGVVQIITVLLQLTGLLENTNKSFVFGGTLGNPNVLAMILALSIFSAFFLLKKLKIIKVEKILLKIFIVTSIAVIVATQCRTALLGLIITGAYFLITRLSIFRSTKFKVLLISAFAISIVFFGFLIYHKSGSLMGRLLIWESSLNVLIDKPFWGYGIDTFHIVYPQGQLRVFEDPNKLALYYNVAGSPYWAYNDVIEFFIEGGVLLAFAFFFLFIATLLRWKNAINVHGEIDFLYIPVVLFFLFGSVNFAFAAWPLLLLFIIYLASCKALHTNSCLIEFSHAAVSFSFGLLLITGCTLTSIKSFCQLNFQHDLLNVNTMEQGNKELFYNKYIKSLPHYLPFVFSYANWLFVNGKEGERIAVLQNANSYFNSYETNLQLADAYLVANDFINAVAHYEVACKILPNRIAPYYHRFAIYSLQEDYVEAESIKRYVQDNYFKGDDQYINQIKAKVSESDPFEQ